jgi:murein DD-endopeptidase MepM/ murein hydrolase activator NlpD
MRTTALLALLLLALSSGCASNDEAGGVLLDRVDSTATGVPTPDARGATATAEPQATQTPAPTAELRLNTTLAAPGSVILASITNTSAAGTAFFLEREFPLAVGDGFMWAVVGLPPDAPLGTHILSITLEDGSSFEEPIEVVDAGYPVEYITLSGETSSLLTPENAAIEREKVQAAYAVFSSERLWSGAFIFPVDTYITSVYGEARSYNGGPVGSHHKGIDFGALEGTPIRAANSGRVILAEFLPLSGNSVIIDHGLGVMTFYAHMVRIDVALDQFVQTGDVLGGVGTTGISTGNHLHWGVLVRGVPVNPHQWTWAELGPP